MVWEDGSLCFGFDAKLDYNYFNMFAADGNAVLGRAQQNRGFRFRYKPRFLHLDELLTTRQDFGRPEAAIVETVEDYRCSTFQWKTFAFLTGPGARADIILWKLAAKENYYPSRTRVVLDSLGDDEGPGKPVIKASSPVKSGNPDSEELFHAGEVLEGAFFILHEGDIPDEEVTVESAKKALAWSETYWEGIRPFQKAFEIPDPQIMEMLAACGRNILQAREVKEGVYSFQVGPTHYRGLWMADGYFILESAHLLGRYEEGFSGILAVLRHVRPDDGIMIMSVHEKETGIAIATLVRQCELMNDDDRIRELWPLICRAHGYIRKLREKADALGDAYPARGLFPPTFGDGGIYGPEPEYTTPAWILFGLKAAYEAGRRLGLPGHEEIGKTFDSIRSAFYSAVRRDTKYTDQGIPYFPMSMRDTGQYQPQTGTWALAQSIAPGEVFAPDEPLVTDFLNLLDSIDNEEGIPENTGWLTHDAVWGYSSMFYGQVWLYGGNGEKAADYLYAFANHASKGRCWREEQALKGRQSSAIWGDMPHNWGSAEFIRLARNLIVLEKQDNLELLCGLPDEWLPTEEARLYLEDTPTKYGRITLEMTREREGYVLRVAADLWRNPQKLILHWRGQGRLSVPAVHSGNGWEMDGEIAVFTAKLVR